MRYVQRVRSKQAKGEMGFKKVTYHRKKGFRWGTAGSDPDGPGDDSPPDKKSGSESHDFEPGFLEHDRSSDGEESHRHLRPSVDANHRHLQDKESDGHSRQDNSVTEFSMHLNAVAAAAAGQGQIVQSHGGARSTYLPS